MEDLSLELVKPDGTKETISLARKSLAAHMDEMELDLSTELSGKLTVDGTYTATLKSTKAGDLAVFSFEVHTVPPTSMNAFTTRNEGTYEANMSLDAYGETDVVKVYLEKVAYSASKPTVLKDEEADKGIKFDEEGNLVSEDLKSFDLTNDRLDNKVVYSGDTELERGTAYKIFYVVEDAYGNRSQVYGPVMIVKDTPLGESVEIEKVELTDFATTTFTNAEVKVTLAKNKAGEDVNVDGKTFRVVLTRDGEPIASKDLPAETADNGKTFTTFKLSQTGANATMLQVPGKYQVSVYVLGDASNSNNIPDSKVVLSEVREVKRLEPVTVAYNAETGKLVIGGNYEVGTTAGKVEGYKVELYTVDAKGVETPLTTVNTNLTSLTNKEITVTMQDSTESYSSGVNLKYNTVYKAKVTVLPRTNQIAEIKSEVTVSEGFFALKPGTIAPVHAKTTDKTITLKIDSLVNIAGENTTYTVEILKKNPAYKSPDETPTVSPYITTGDVRANLVPERVKGEDILVVDGLTPDTEYVFQVTVNAGDAKGYVLTTAETTLKSLPSLTGLTVVEGPTTKAGEIAKTESGLSVGGVDIATADVTKYPAELGTVNSLLNDSNLQVGDVFTYDDNGLKVNIGDRSTPRTFTAPEKLTVEANKFSRKLTVSSPGVKDLTLTGNGEFDLTGNTFTTVSPTNVVSESIKLTVESEVSVTNVPANTLLTVAKGASNAKINGVTVSSSLETELVMRSATNIEVRTTAENQNNNLTFNAPNGLVVLFTREDHTLSQTGSVTVTAGGAVTVSGKDMYVSGAVSVDTSSATGTYSVHLNDSNVTGTKTLKVSGQPKVYAYAAEVAPFELADYSDGEKGIEIKEYTVEEDNTFITKILTAEKVAGGKYADYVGTSDKDDELKAKIVEELNTYLRKFGIPMDLEATIDMNKGKFDVIFDFSAVSDGVENLVITGLK